jgi:tetratricopeptide (TPR) repeat protein
MRIIRINILTLICLTGFIFLSCPSSFPDEENPPQQKTVKPASEEPQPSYVYDLKSLIEKSKNNIKRVNEKIKEQAIYKRNLQREEKAREYYDRAMLLFEEGKVDEARELFEKSIRITENPEMKGYIKVSEKKFKSQAAAMRKEGQERVSLTIAQERERQQQVQDAYEKGVTLYKRQNYKAAKDEFMLVEQLIPEFKATRSYLKLLEEKMAVEEKADIVNQKKEIVRQQKEAEAGRIREKEMWRKELELKEQERQRKLMDQARQVYAEATKFYKNKDFTKAKEKFQEVEWVVPDYKSTRSYLERLDQDIKEGEQVFEEKQQEGRAKEEWNEELIRKKLEAEQKKTFEARSTEDKHKAAQEASIHYQSANDLMVQKKYAQARDEFLTVQKIYPDYKATAAYLARLNKTLGIIETAPDKVEPQVKAIYVEALQSYKEKDYATAKLKFEQVEFMYPDYMATRKYISRMGKEDDLKPSEELPSENINDKSKPVHVGQDVDKKGYEVLVGKAEPLYAQAVTLYDEKKYNDALKQFEMVESVLPNYKATRPYIKRVNHQIKRVEQQRYKEEQTEQAQTINVLAKQASVLYTKISQLADDRSTSQAQKKFAFIEKLFINMSKEQAKLLAEIAEEEEKLRLEEIAYEQEVQQSEFVNAIDPIYQEAVRLYQSKKFDDAKAKFLEAQTKIADYRSSKRYLNLIDKQNQLLQQTMKDRESQITQFQSKAAQNAELAANMEIKTKERVIINDLLAQAEAINDEIVALSKDRNFEAIKIKFAELEEIVDHLLTIKTTVAQRDHPEATGKESKDVDLKEGKQKSKSAEPADASKSKSETDNRSQSADEGKNKSAQKESEDRDKIDRNKADSQKSEAQKTLTERRRIEREKANQQIRLRQIAKKNRDMYHQALRSFYARHYSDAKTRFLQLEQNAQYGASARKYIQKMDDLILHQQSREAEKQDKKRKEYIESRAERQRMSFNIRQANRDDTLESGDGPRTDAVRYSMAHPENLNLLNLRARQPVVRDIVDQEQVSQMKDAPVSTDEESDQVVGMSPNEDASWLKRRSQRKLSDRRKKYFEDKQKAEEKKNQAMAEASSKSANKDVIKKAVKLSEKQRRQEAKLRNLYEQELRTSKSSSGFDDAFSKLEKEKKDDVQSEIEKQKGFLRQQREEEKSLRQEKERKIINRINRGQGTTNLPLRGGKTNTQEAALKVDSNNFSENSGRAPSVPKDTVQKKFDNGLAKMYAEALGYYKNHSYKEARDRFTDIEDIAPDYKRTHTYLGRIEEEILKEQKRHEQVREDRHNNVIQKIDTPRIQKVNPVVPAEAPVNRQNAVSSALDDFESKSK